MEKRKLSLVFNSSVFTKESSIAESCADKNQHRVAKNVRNTMIRTGTDKNFSTIFALAYFGIKGRKTNKIKVF